MELPYNARGHRIPTGGNPGNCTFGNPRYNKVRDLFFTYKSNFSLINRGDTGINLVSDLKGKKVNCIFPAGPANETTMKALLKEYGLDFDKDIVAMKYSTIIEMYESLKERRVDAIFGTALRINLEEQDRSPGGAHILSIPREKIITGNKRFAMALVEVFIEKNGFELQVTEEEYVRGFPREYGCQ